MDFKSIFKIAQNMSKSQITNMLNQISAIKPEDPVPFLRHIHANTQLLDQQIENSKMQKPFELEYLWTGGVITNDPNYAQYKDLSQELHHTLQKNYILVDNTVSKYKIRPSALITPTQQNAMVQGAGSSVAGRDFIFSVISANISQISDSIDDTVRLIEADEAERGGNSAADGGSDAEVAKEEDEFEVDLDNKLGTDMILDYELKNNLLLQRDELLECQQKLNLEEQVLDDQIEMKTFIQVEMVKRL